MTWKKWTLVAAVLVVVLGVLVGGYGNWEVTWRAIYSSDRRVVGR